MSRSRADIHLDLNREFGRLQRLSHPRIAAVRTNERVTVSIDLWCDGDEAAATQVMQLTRKQRSLTSLLELA